MFLVSLSAGDKSYDIIMWGCRQTFNHRNRFISGSIDKCADSMVIAPQVTTQLIINKNHNRACAYNSKESQKRVDEKQQHNGLRR